MLSLFGGLAINWTHQEIHPSWKDWRGQENTKDQRGGLNDNGEWGFMGENENPGVKHPNLNIQDPADPKEKTLLESSTFYF